MSPKSRTSSGSSLVSLDPTIVSHITSTKSTTSKHTRTGSTPVHSRNAPPMSYVKGHGRTFSAPSKNGHKRSHSLRRTKNSTEMLRQRSKKSIDEKSPDLSSDPKRGRNFTVTNVGTGGMLYLRPSSFHKNTSPTIAPPPVVPMTAPISGSMRSSSKGSTPQPVQGGSTSSRQAALTARTRSVSPKRMFGRLAKSRAEQQPQRPNHSRSQSFSTLDESRKSITSGWPKTLKIIINRFEQNRDPSPEAEPKPPLQIPIPHYRLGRPRFSVHGTPQLRSSVLSQSSSGSSIHRVSVVKGDSYGSGPPPASLKAFAKLQSMESGAEQQVEDQPPPARAKPAKDPSHYSAMSLGFAPSIYDDLNEMYNDSNVVRFAHDVRDVTAATPARIIAQISSESFMDYELVSDFFLTFRSYMTPSNVLDLLLARLAWAIGRMSDDGRIIRIRTFAALRHWILNYFMDDFVPDRKLRVRFCDEVNELYDEVRNRQAGGASDLKILQDLKRCWNGRCSLYWDGDYFNMDSVQETDLYPGGVIGSRHPDYTNITEIDDSESEESFPLPHTAPAAISAVPTSQEPRPKSPSVQQQQQTSQQQIRQKPSVISTGPTESLASEQSIQANSCSILYKGHRIIHDGHARLKKPRLVTVLERRQKAPSDLKVTTSRPNSVTKHHKRGGNSFDSTRERTPHEVEPPTPVPWTDHRDGSVIRGFAYAPVEPFVHIPAQVPQSPAGQYILGPATPTDRRDNQSDLQLNGPAVKNVFGSIRRALSGKHGANEMAYITISGPISNASLATKRSQLPLNVSKSQDELRKRTMQASQRTPIRIDLLCAAAVESYQASVPPTDLAAFPKAPLEILKDQIDGQETHNEISPDAPDMDRIRSHITSQSGSIVIVDGTGLGIPAMSGALAYPQSHVSRSSGNVVDIIDPRPASYETQIAFRDDSKQALPEHSHAPPEIARIVIEPPESPMDTGSMENPLSSTASTTTVKHRRSLASTIGQARPETSAGETASTVTQLAEESDGEGARQPAQLLRRRPGGDLRKNQNVHDLASPVPHHESLDSLADTISSPAESLIIMNNAPPLQPYAIQKAVIKTKDGIQRVSMINTHSSQHLRPSFEAAVAGFSDIPDDDDGGLEATLLKLEGRYEKTSPELDGSSPPLSPGGYSSSTAIPITLVKDPELSTTDNIVYRGYPRQPHFATSANIKGSPGGQTQMPSKIPVLAHKAGNIGLAISSVPDAQSSQVSLPLLQRSSAAVSRETTPKLSQTSQMPAITPPASVKTTPRPDTAQEEKPLSKPGSHSMLRPETAHTERSFLLDDDEEFSDLSSEMSVDIVNYSEAMGGTGSPILVAPGTAISGLEIPSHPLAHSSLVDLTMEQSPALVGNWNANNKPLTPEPSPNISRSKPDVTAKDVKRSPDQKMARRSIPVGPAHVPFILACDSQILAQQLTLIEQSALTEVEWSDLVEMRWSNQPAKVLDWAEYVTKQDVKGVDIVITRFNLMVKWALSEIVLTQDMEERVRVITKFIHIAAHARRLHNYATMLQITIALTSTDCTRLIKTWQQVPEPDKSLLKNMEALIQPVRNFHDLRVEMESADLTGGCIPFIGLYVHDLTYNAQKPAEIEAGRHNPPLINFERFRTAAVIVKGLLRLIDASSKYDFDPIQGIVERCLWIAALEDERIRTLSKTLEIQIGDE